MSESELNRTDILFSSELAGSLRFRMTEAEDERVLGAIRAEGAMTSVIESTMSVAASPRAARGGGNIRDRHFSRRRWTSLGAAAVAVVAVGGGLYTWKPWSTPRGVQGAPALAHHTNTAVQQQYQQLIGFVPIVPAHVPEGYRQTVTKTGRYDVKGSVATSFETYYTTPSNGLITLTEWRGKRNFHTNWQHKKTVQVNGAKVIFGIEDNSVAAEYSYGASDVIVNNDAVNPYKNPQNIGQVSHDPAEMSQLQQQLKNFVSSIVTRPTEVSAAPNYMERLADGDSALQKIPFTPIYPQTPSGFHITSSKDLSSYSVIHGKQSLISVTMTYWNAAKDQIIVGESHGGYTRQDGVYQSADESGEGTGASVHTILVAGQKVALNPDHLNLKWEDPNTKVVYNVNSTPGLSASKTTQVMKSIIKQVLPKR